jgi:hypothetical protein
MSTRGLVASQIIEQQILNAHQQYGTKLVEGHGVLVPLNQPVTKPVPKDTIIIFLSEPGKCMWIHAGRVLARRYFMSNNSLRNFFMGGGGAQGVHHGEILSRTFVPGQEYPNMIVEFHDNEFPGFGWVRKLPLTRNLAENANNMRKEGPPERGEIYNRINHGPHASYYLSQILTYLGPGVYIINACMPAPNFRRNRLPVTSATWNLYAGNKLTRTGPVTKGLRRLRKVFPRTATPARTPKPGTPRRTWTPEVRRMRPPRTRETVHSVLRAIGRDPLSPKNEQYNRLPANTNLVRIKHVKFLMSHRRVLENYISGLSWRAQMKWAITPRTMRPAFLHRHLKNNNAF